MKLFFNFNKEGKGVTKADVAAESPIKRFFTEFLHRFWQLVLLNVIYVIACIPIITIGPATAAMNYVCRNFSQAKPVSFFTDFIEKCKEHFKQGLIVSLIQVALGALLTGSFLSWTSESFNVPTALRTAAVIVILLFAYILIFGSFFIYPMMVSFDLKIKQLIRNSVILALTQLWRNIVIFLVLALMAFLTFLFWPMSLPVPLFLFFTLLCYVSNGLIYPVLARLVAREEPPEDQENSPEISAEEEK